MVMIFDDSFARVVVMLCKLCESSLLGEQYMNCFIVTEEVNVFKPYFQLPLNFSHIIQTYAQKTSLFSQEYVVILFSS